jgi:hypothetical protein
MNTSETGAMVAPAGVLHNLSSVRAGLTGASTDLGGVIMGLSIAEGRGDWASLAEDYRLGAAHRALTELDDVIAKLADWRATLAEDLGESTQLREMPLPAEMKAALAEAADVLDPQAQALIEAEGEGAQ